MRLTIFLSVLIGGLGGACQALAGPPAVNKGKVLILENERVLEGDVEKVGTQYLIRRTVGETWVPAERVLAMCQDKTEAYQFLRVRANLGDPDEHLRLAHWCHLNGLPAQALTEVAEAVKLRPGHRASQALLAHLQQSAAAKPAAARAIPSEQQLTSAPPIDLTEEALGHFATRVQPILMNTCAGCHVASKGGAFRLTRTYDTTLLNRKAVQQNLAAVLSQVNTAQPNASPFLTKSVSVHGEMTQSTLKNRQAAAYRTLEDWVKKAVSDNPQLRDSVAIAPPPPVAATTPVAARAVPTTPIKPEPAHTKEPAPPMQPSEGNTSTQGEPKQPDPFDPAEFNKQAAPPKR